MTVHPLRIVAGVLLTIGGFVVAVSALAIGLGGLLRVLVGRDPCGPAASTAGPSLDGIEMLAGFTLLYLAVIVSLAAARTPRRLVTMGAAA